MIKFNKDNKKTLTYGEALNPIAKITSKEEAKQYFADYVQYMKNKLAKKPNEDGKTAEQICKSNIGYYAGYFDSKTMSKIYKLFETAHPVFSKVKPTPEEAYNKGVELGKSMR